MIPVAEIFGPTIQGEGPNTGIKTLFVRVVGCDFKCSWCDSKFAWKVNKDTKYYKEEELGNILVEKCKKSNTSNVILTGGNPCLYDFEEVIDILHKNKIKVDIETQGSIFPEWMSKLDTVVISPKAPSSGMEDVYYKIGNWLDKPEVNNHIVIKIPVFDDNDFEFAKKYYELCEDYREHYSMNIDLCINVGNDDTAEQGDISKRILDNYRKLIDKVMDSEMKRVYVMPQVHTLVWGNKQGV